MIVTSKSFIRYLESIQDKHSDIRLGQHMFNELYNTNPKLADNIRGGILDPFYSDDIIPSFLLYIVKEWNSYIDD